jgi:coproporphyrinogen III oxidase-like Fe-S oxidoreductase
MAIIDDLPWPPQARVGSVFFGGGTPSLMSLQNLERIVTKLRAVFIRGASPQITIEVNPESTTRHKVDAWKALGINRISMGVQSFDQQVLEDYNRAHDVGQLLHVVREVAKTGMLFNIDLLYGSRSQTASSFGADVQRAIELSAPHITLHPYFFGLPDKDKLRRQLKMYEVGADLLLSHGYDQYAVFEFARTEAAKSQNIIDAFVEPAKDVIALGAGAYGSNRRRGPYYKYKKVSTYQACIERGIPPFFVNRDDDGARDTKRLGLDGLYGLKINRRECKAVYGDDPYLKYQVIFDMLAAVGHVEVTDDQIIVRRPFRQGLLIMASWFDAIKMPKDPAIEEILKDNPKSRVPGSGMDRLGSAGL